MKELGLLVGIVIGSGVIDVYVGWIGMVGVKVKLFWDYLDELVVLNDVL